MSEKYPLVSVTGPRQSGKSTLLKHLFPEYRYLTLEDPDVREFAISDPRFFLKTYNDKVILDEVQRTPELFSYLQGVVDESDKSGQYLLSGSQNFLLMQSITQSLAGRVSLTKLLPFSFKEAHAGASLSLMLLNGYGKADIQGYTIRTLTLQITTPITPKPTLSAT